MFPSKGMVDYMGETNRSFTTIRMDGDTSFNILNFPFQTPVANRSSSSTDTSPESYFGTPYSSRLTELNQQPESLSSRRLYESNRSVYEPSKFYDTPANVLDSGVANNNLHCNTGLSSDRNLNCFDPQIFDQRQISDTPLARYRPIVGRKIYGSQSGLFGNDPETRSETSDCYKVESQYELFPSNEKSFEFLTPIKKTDFTPKYTSPSSSISNVPSQSSQSVHNFAQITTQSTFPWHNRIRCSIPEFKVPFNPASCTSSDEIKPSKMCTFCRKNGETPYVYTTHCVKEKIGNAYKVTCPILRSHVCTQCGASGDDAHTITYCPILKTINNGKPLKSTTITLKNTRLLSNGRRRY